MATGEVVTTITFTAITNSVDEALKLAETVKAVVKVNSILNDGKIQYVESPSPIRIPSW